MKINADSTLKSMNSALSRLEKKADTTGQVSVGDIRNPPLKELARTIQTGCSSSVSVTRLKQALKTVGADVKKADKDQDGKLDAKEQAKLSPLAARLLHVAKKDTPSGGTVSTGCGSSTPSRPSVSTGCSKPAPSRPSVPTPAKPPVRTGC